MATARLIQLVRPSHLLHLAWKSPGDWNSVEHARWVGSSADLLKAFVAEGGRRAVVAGSCAEYDYYSGDGVCSEQTTPVSPQSGYGRAKHALHLHAQRICREHGVGLAWGRIFSVYGPGESEHRLVPSITRALLQGETAPCTEGSQLRDFIYSEDVARALLRMLASEFSGVVNIGSGEATPVRSVIDQIGRETGRSDLIRYGAIKRHELDPDAVVADVDRMVSMLQFTSEVPLEEGITRTVAWWRSRLI